MPLYKHSIPCSFRFKLVVINDLVSKATHVRMLAVSQDKEFVGNFELREYFQNGLF